MSRRINKANRNKPLVLSKDDRRPVTCLFGSDEVTLQAWQVRKHNNTITSMKASKKQEVATKAYKTLKVVNEPTSEATAVKLTDIDGE